MTANGAGNISSFVGLTSGGQEVSNIIVTPVSGSCIGPDSTFQLVVNPLDDPGFSYPQYSYCTDDTPNPLSTIDVAGGTFSFVATTGGPNLVLDSNTGLIDLVNSNEGVYDITYTTSGVCPQDSTITMVINFTPTVNAVLDQTVCHASNFSDIVFSGTSGTLPTTFNWINDNATIGLSSVGVGDILSFTSNNTSASQISVIITVTASSATCIGTPTTFNLNVDPLDDPSFQFNGGLTYCAIGTNPVGNITGMTGGTFSYIVNSGGPNLSINTATGDVDLSLSNSGSYDVTYTTAGVCPQSSTLTLVITDAPIANFSFGEYCAMDIDPMPDYANDDQGVLFPNGGSGGIFTEVTGNLIVNSATGEVDLSASVPGTYTITNTINVVGCATATAFDDITIHQMPFVDPLTDTTLCSDAALPVIYINVNGEAPTWTIIYELDGAVQPFLAGQTLPLQIPNVTFGTYEIVSVSDQYCTSIISETITVESYPVVSMQNMTDYSACEGEVINVTDFAGVPVGNIYDWVFTNGSDIGFGTNGTGNIGSFTASNPQTVTVEVTPTSNATNGSCVGPPVLFDITVNPLPVVQFTADIFSGCEPTTITFTDQSTNGSTYDWTFGDGNTANGPLVSHTYDNAGVYDVGLTVTSTNGCVSSATETSYINITPMPVASFSFTPDVTDISHPEIEFNNSSIDADYYEWDFGDETALSNEVDPIHVYADEPNQYHIWLLATNNNGLCRDSIDAFLTVNDIILYYVPNVFTPDFDEFNQTFKPIFTSGFNPQDYHLMIFNRWGELIFESYNAAIGWDGTYPENGKLCQDGVYVWKIEFKETMSDKRHNITGHVSLLK